MDKEDLKRVLMEAVEVVSLINELLKKETLVGVDYTGVYEDLRWNKIMLRNRLEALEEVEAHWVTAKEYFEKLDEE